MKALLRAAVVSMGGLVIVMSSVAMPQAADLKVLAGGSLTVVLGELGPQFERATGHKLVIEFGSTPQLIKQVVSGAQFDLGVVPAELFKDAGARARFAPASSVIWGRGRRSPAAHRPRRAIWRTARACPC